MLDTYNLYAKTSGDINYYTTISPGIVIDNRVIYKRWYINK